MSSSQPIIRQIKWFSIVPQMLVLIIICGIYYFFSVQDYILFGTGTYLVLFFALRNIIPRSHRKGISYFKKKEYENSIHEFEKSYEFFKMNKWIDKYRFLTLLSSSRVSYTEMALINIAFCYAQVGDGAKSKEFYERALKEFPDSQMAITALKMIDAASKIDNQ